MSHTHLLRPLDKLFIKDGRPLSLEDDSAASGIFPPPPSVIYGALRSAVLAKADQPAKAIHTDADPAKGQRATLTGLAFAKTKQDTTTLFFPAPFDLVRKKEKDKERRERLDGNRLSFVNDNAMFTSSPTPRLLGTSKADEAVEAVGGYVSAEGLAAYMRGEQVAAAEIMEASNLYTPEPKLGIGLNYQSGTTEEGLIYTMAMQRLKPGVTLAVSAEGFDSTLELLRLGAEARAAEVLDGPAVAWPAAVTPVGKSFTLYLATPAVFKQGWLPDFLDPTSHTGELGGASVKLLAASTGRYIPLGGWDIVAGRPKPMRRAVPAGSVYHFSITGGTFDVVAVHGLPLGTNFPHSGRKDGDHLTYQQQGFGIAYIGKAPQDLQAH